MYNHYLKNNFAQILTEIKKTESYEKSENIKNNIKDIENFLNKEQSEHTALSKNNTPYIAKQSDNISTTQKYLNVIRDDYILYSDIVKKIDEYYGYGDKLK